MNFVIDDQEAITTSMCNIRVNKAPLFVDLTTLSLRHLCIIIYIAFFSDRSITKLTLSYVLVYF